MQSGCLRTPRPLQCPQHSFNGTFVNSAAERCAACQLLVSLATLPSLCHHKRSQQTKLRADGARGILAPLLPGARLAAHTSTQNVLGDDLPGTGGCDGHCGSGPVGKSQEQS